AEDGIRDFHVTGVQTCALPIYSSGIGAIVYTFGNSSLSWQQTFTTDAGFDLGLFNDRLTITPRVYRRLTRDILADITIAPSTGRSEERRVGKDSKCRGRRQRTI